MQSINISKSEYLELLRYKEMVHVLEDILHEPHFKVDFVKRVEEAEARVEKGEKVHFKSIKELRSYLGQSD